MTRVLVLPSAHGRGHAARMRVLSEALAKNGASVTTAPADAPRLDVGVRLWDAARAGTVGDALDRLALEAPARLDAWRRVVSRAAPDLVVADADPHPLAAASAEGVPALLVSNFTWLDLVRAWGHDAPWLARLHDGAHAAALPLRLPLAGVPHARVVDVPHLAWPIDAPPPPADGRRLRALLSLGSGHAALPERVLADAPTDLLVAEDAQRPAAEAPVRVLRVAPPLAARAAECDLVIAKASYGAVSEALAARRPMVLVPRPDGAEDAVIVDALTRVGVAVVAPPGRPLRVPAADDVRRIAGAYEGSPTWARCDPMEVARAVLSRA